MEPPNMEPPNNESLLSVRGLWKVFGNLPQDFSPDASESTSDSIKDLQDEGMVFAVRDVCFEVKPGEVFVIMGLSGSGKSTLIRCIPRLMEPTLGEIEVKGQNVLKMDEKELIEFRRQETAMVFQHYGLLPHRNVIENVAFGLKLRGVTFQDRKDKARDAIARVGLEGWEEHYPAQLSGGMRQRVGIARALVQDSDLLLMDEPFSGLDPLIRGEMQETLGHLQNEFNKTIIFVTHDLNEAIRLGDRMAVMKEGVFVQQGTPEEVINHPVDEYVERFVSSERTSVATSKKQQVFVPAPALGKKPSSSKSATTPLTAVGRR